VIKVKVEEGQSEFNLFKAAMTLAEAGMGQFDEIVAILRECNLDENAALVKLIEKKKEENSIYE